MTKRLQILIDTDRYARLERQAAQRGASVATLMREAIDLAFPDDGPTRPQAAQRLLDAQPVPVTDWPMMKAELDQIYVPASR